MFMLKFKRLADLSHKLFGQGAHGAAAEAHAEAREMIEKDDPARTVAQLHDGRLAIVAKAAYEEHRNGVRVDSSTVHAELAAKLDAEAAAPPVDPEKVEDPEKTDPEKVEDPEKTDPAV